MRNETLPRECGECERQTREGFVRTVPNSLGGEAVKCSSACCMGEHTDEEPCDVCPFSLAAPEGLLALRLFHTCAHKSAGGKGEAPRWVIAAENISLAFETYRITDKQWALELIHLGAGILNGDTTPERFAAT